MKQKALVRLLSVALFVVVSTGLSHAQTFYGPSHYFQLADSPFASFGDLQVENFEDGPTWNFSGVTHNIGEWTRTRFAPYVDSVEFGGNGNSWFVGEDPSIFVLSFVESTLGGLPQHAGIVATDGIGRMWFRAYGRSGQLLGELTGDHFNPLLGGDPDEDRFYGVSFAGGISRLEVQGASLEMDHIQYAQPVPEPTTLVVLALGTAILAKWRKK